MKQFSSLLERLILTASRNKKIDFIADYFANAKDPSRGYVLVALASELDIKTVKSSALKKLMLERVDPHLFQLSYDYVGDLAETISLMWPDDDKRNEAKTPLPEIHEIISLLNSNTKKESLKHIENWLSIANANERWALIKLITGGLRVGVSARLAKTALSKQFDKPIEEIEKIWHGLTPPYEDLFMWLEDKAPKPEIDPNSIFHPLMLSNPIDKDKDFDKLDAEKFSAEWKWDGIRVQLSINGDAAKLFSRTGDDISATFPDIIEHANGRAVLDGELLVGTPRPDQEDQKFNPKPFNDLQQRLNRKTVVKKHLKDLPAFVRVYDILFLNDKDVRDLPWLKRRQLLEEFLNTTPNDRLDLSKLIDFESWDELATLREDGVSKGIEGVMIKLKTSPYLAGRPKGPWFKWKRDPMLADAILMYAQRGHGKRSSFYSDYTFGVWKGNEIVPIGKAYFGFTDAELKQIDKWVRKNTINKFGPVREVKKELVFEVAFDSVHQSNRHKSGLALRFPRIHRIRWDKPAQEADILETVEALIE